MSIVIYHNPGCSTSRNAVALIRASGEDPVIIEYLKSGWTEAQLRGLFAAAGITPRQAMRSSRSPAETLGLLEDGVTDETILTAMVEHPELVERPIVCSPRGVALCRPIERVFDLIANADFDEFTKENGDVVRRSPD